MSPRSPRSWLLELALAAGAVALGAFFTHASVSQGEGAPLGVELVAGALTVVALLTLRRTRPVTLTLVLIPAGIFLGMPMGATPTALFTVGVQRPPRFAIGLAALHAVAVAVVYALALGLTPLYYESVAFLVLLHVSVVAVALLVRSQRQLVVSWAERARQAEEGERLRVDQARRAERERVAREMHDVLAHRISLLAVHAGALEVRRGADPAEQQAAGVIRQCAHDALEDLRTVIGMLRTSPEPASAGGPDPPGEDEDHPAPTLSDVPALIEQSRAAGAQIRLTVRADGLPLPREHAAPPGAVASPGDVAPQGAVVSPGDVAPQGAVVSPGAVAPQGAVVSPGAVAPQGDVVSPGAVASPGDVVSPGAVASPGGGDLALCGGGDGALPGGGDGALRGGGDVALGGGDLSDRAGRHAYRIVQEALTNARRHAPGAPVAVVIDGSAARGLTLEIDNPLTRGTSATSGGFGLVGLRERVTLAGGRLEHGPTPSGGFRVRAWLPWHP